MSSTRLNPSLGAQLARAIAAKDAQALIGPFAIFRHSRFGPDKVICDVTPIVTDTLSDVEKVSYQIAVDLDSGPSLIEQVAYYSVTDGQITDLRLVCSASARGDRRGT